MFSYIALRCFAAIKGVEYISLKRGERMYDEQTLRCCVSQLILIIPFLRKCMIPVSIFNICDFFEASCFTLLRIPRVSRSAASPTEVPLLSYELNICSALCVFWKSHPISHPLRCQADHSEERLW